MKQTAVEWLVEQIFKHNNLVKGDGWFYIKPDIIEQAKAMEKEQIMYAYVEGCSDSILDESTDKKRSEDYYNENYGK